MTPDETIRQAAAFYQKYRIENQPDGLGHRVPGTTPRASGDGSQPP